MADGTIKILTDLDASGFQKGISKLGSIASVGLKATTAAITAAGGALTALAGVSIKTGMSFEQQMSRVNAISGATAEEFAALEKQAIDLGASTAFSATEAAEGMENLASAGFSTTEIMEAMPGMLDLAASSGADLAQSADIAASTLRGFGLEAADAGHVADVLAKTAADTNAAVEDTGEAMKYVAPVAHAFGISMEETAAAIGIMSDAGIKGSQAGTTLRGALSRLAKPTDVMQDTMDALGISFFNAEGKMLSLTEMTEMLKDKTAGLTDEQRNAALVTLFGQESLSGMLALMDAGPKKIGSLTTSLENCDGAAAEMAETMTDNLAGAVEEFSGAAETLGILAYKSIEGPLKKTVQAVTKYIGQLQKAFEKNGLEGAVSELGEIFANVATDIAQQAPKVAKAAASLIKSFVSGLSKNSKQIAKAAIEIGKTLLDGIKDVIPEVVSAAIEITSALADNLFGSQVGDAMRRLGDTLQGTFQTVFKTVDSVINIVSPLVGAFGGPLLDIVNVLAQAINGLLTGVNFVLSAIEGFTTGLNTLFWGAQTTAESVVAFTEAEMKLKEQADSVAEAIKNQHQQTLESMESTNTSMDHTSKLATELLGLADASGRVKESDQARAQFILDTLNEALGTEYEMTDGVIQKYDELTSSVYEVIEAKRVDALMNAYYEDYALALQNVTDAEQRMIQGLDDYAARRKTTQEIERQYREALEYWQTASEQGWIEENGVYKEYTAAMSLQDKQRADELRARFEEERRLTAASEDRWHEYQSEYGEINSTINSYERAYEEVLNGSYEEAQRILQGKSDAYDEHAETVSDTTNAIKQNLHDEETAASTASSNIRRSLNQATEGVGEKASREINEAVDTMEEKTSSTTLTGPEMGAVRGAAAAASVAINAMQAVANSRSISVSARVNHASGGYWAKGGVTKYARGGVSPEIHKHAAGVFTKRTRLWDPVTGINEYGEAGHEALLPLKQSVYDEIAKGIVRQLSPAKLSGLVAMLKSAVQSRAEAVTVQVVEKRELNAAEKALSPAPDTDGLRAELAALRDKLDRIVDALRNAVPGLEDIASVMAQAFSGLKVVMDSQPVGRLVTPAVNERLNDLYDLEERGRF